jgi:predicted P-loop ATPase
MSAMLEAALRYAALGWSVFPIHSIRFDGKCGCGKEECWKNPKNAGKHPRIKWKAGATCDVETVRAYWTKWPNAGIGCATGPSGLLVADGDAAEGILALRAVAGPLPPTARSRTARGVHVFFRGQGGTRSDPNRKLDTRGTGGYVVLPPSPHVSGHIYRWEVEPEAGIAEAPETLVAWSLEKKRRFATVPGTQFSEAAPAPRTGDDDFTTKLSGALVDWHEIDQALRTIPADCKMDTWIRVGMALHATGDSGALARWDQWSSKGGDKYRGQTETAYKWTTFKAGGGVGLGTLFAIAREHGFRREVMQFDAGGKHPDETRPPLLNGAGAETPHGMNGHASALPASFRETAIHFPDVTEGGKVKATCRNVRIAMRHLGITAEEDEFHDRMRIGGQPLGQWAGELTDNAVFALRSLIEHEYGFDPPTTATFEAAVQECIARRHHPIKNYFESLQWDRTPRLDTWLCRYLGADDNPFNRAVSRLSLIAAVRRILQPGCKFDQIIVLEGVEGKGKSSAIEILAGSDNFSDQLILGLRDKEQQEVIQGVWLYEIADLAGHGHAEVEKVKAFASRTIDRARPAYGRKRIDIPRRCIFFGTTNDKSYLKSQTGNRRFWPVECRHVDLEALRRDRDQLWAEAVLAERGASLVLPEVLWGSAAALQESRRAHDPWDDKLSNLERTTWAKLVETADGAGEWRVPSRTLLDDVLGLPSDRQSDVAAKRLAYAMRRLGWECRLFRIEGVPHRGYVKSADASIAANPPSGQSIKK